MPEITVIIADGAIDSLVPRAESPDHIRELRSLGFKVILRHFPNWQAAEDFEDRFNDHEDDSIWTPYLDTEDPQEVVSEVRRFGLTETD